MPKTATSAATHAFPRELGNLLAGEHLFPADLTDEQRIVGLTNLAVLWDAVMATGWHAHTGDWDWSVRIETDDNVYDNINVRWQLMARELQLVLDSTVSFTACVNYGTVTNVKFWYEDENSHDEIEVNIPPSAIRRIYIEEL